MKKTLNRLAIAAALLGVTGSCWAGSLDYLSNQSAGYYFNAAQGASTDGAGIVPYNPAGTALLEKGFYLDASSQTLFKMYSESEDAILNDDYKANHITPFIPNCALVYNFGRLGPGKLAVYGNAGIVAGGGDLKWDDGNVGTQGFALESATSVASSVTASLKAKGVPAAYAATSVTGYSTELEASSIYYGFGGGLSYTLLDDRLSLSAGMKYVNAQRSGKIKGTMNFATVYPKVGEWQLDIVDDYDYTAQGFTPVFGVNVRPTEKLTVGVRYEMETALEFEYSVNSLSADASVAGMDAVEAGVIAMLDNDGRKADMNLPAILSVGVDYAFSPKLSASFTSVLYFMNAADYEGMEDDFGVGYELSAGARYRPTEKLALGGTVMYSNQGAKSSFFENDTYILTTSANPLLNSVLAGLGAKYAVLQNLDLLLAGGYIYYIPESATSDAGLDLTYEKQVVDVSVGASFKL